MDSMMISAVTDSASCNNFQQYLNHQARSGASGIGYTVGNVAGCGGGSCTVPTTPTVAIPINPFPEPCASIIKPYQSPLYPRPGDINTYF